VDIRARSDCLTSFPTTASDLIEGISLTPWRVLTLPTMHGKFTLKKNQQAFNCSNLHLGLSSPAQPALQ
jgi:hypothetical protein